MGRYAIGWLGAPQYSMPVLQARIMTPLGSNIYARFRSLPKSLLETFSLKWHVEYNKVGSK